MAGPEFAGADGVSRILTEISVLRNEIRELRNENRELRAKMDVMEKNQQRVTSKVDAIEKS